eukprot:gene16732-biopygen16868
MTMYLLSRSERRVLRFRINWNFFRSESAFSVDVMFSKLLLMNTCSEHSSSAMFLLKSMNALSKVGVLWSSGSWLAFFFRSSTWSKNLSIKLPIPSMLYSLRD